MNRFALTLVVAVLLVGGVLVFPGAGAEVQSDQRPTGATTEVELVISPDSDHVDGVTVTLRWTTRYPARSAAEAERAQEEELDVDWFHGDEETAAFRSAYSDSEREPPQPTVQLHSSEYEHGEIVVWSHTTVTLQLGTDTDQLVLGPNLTESLAAGDSFRVELLKKWEPVSATTEPEPSNVQWKTYYWRIGEDPAPRFELNASGVPDDPEAHGEAGNGPIVAVVALAIVTLALAAKRRRW